MKKNSNYNKQNNTVSDNTQVYRGGLIHNSSDSVDSQNSQPENGDSHHYQDAWEAGYKAAQRDSQHQTYDDSYEDYAELYNDDTSAEYDPSDNYYDEDDYSAGEYDDGYDAGYSYEDEYENSQDMGYDEESGYSSSHTTMAARAAGMDAQDPYEYRRGQAHADRRESYSKRNSQRRTAAKQSYPASARRRKKHHGLRNFLIVLAVLIGLFFLIFTPPQKETVSGKTRKTAFYNILVCATDEGGGRTDTMMMLTLDPSGNTVSITSLPRDTIVDNGSSVPKLNGVYGMAGGGEEGALALMDAVQGLLGFRPDGYMILDYQLFKDAVNALGGVTFDVPMDMDFDDGTVIYAGEQLLDGDQALLVCRYREGYLMADIQREYVQQQFVKAMIKQALSPSNWRHLPALYRVVMNEMLTDLSGGNIRYVALRVLLGGVSDIAQYTLPGEGVDYYGASCYGLYGQSVVDLVNEVMNPFKEDITIDEVDILTVSGGELVPSTSTGEAFDAGSYDYGS